MSTAGPPCFQLDEGSAGVPEGSALGVDELEQSDQARRSEMAGVAVSRLDVLGAAPGSDSVFGFQRFEAAAISSVV